jgi:hypothetical protein
VIVECKKLGVAWEPARDHLRDHLQGNGNDSKNCYGMLQVGLELQFFKYEGRNFSPLGGKMHLINNATTVMDWGRHIKVKPMPFV